VLESHKKQDDMTDAFLQGLVMNFKTGLPEHYAKKIRSIDTSNLKVKEEYEVDYEITAKSRSLTENGEENEITMKIGKKKNPKSKSVDDVDQPEEKIVKTKMPIKIKKEDIDDIIDDNIDNILKDVKKTAHTALTKETMTKKNPIRRIPKK
jgi:hypothetical protein